MIDRHYGHLARDGREHAIRLLDGYADIKAADVQASDVRWTPQLAHRRRSRQRKQRLSRRKPEPSDGLEPSTPSLPWTFVGGTGGHGRALAITFLLQIAPSQRVSRARACPPVPRLMYPSRTRGLSTV